MFAYCGNNPVCATDAAGQFPYSVGLTDGGGKHGTGGGSLLLIFAVLSGVIPTILAYKTTKTAATVICGTLSEDRTQKKEYTVYGLTDEGGNVQYVGRTMNPEARKQAHKQNPDRKNLEFQEIATTTSCGASRILEQGFMLLHHTINSTNKANNQINGISRSNPNLAAYFAVGKELPSYLWNQVSNEILFWLGS